MRWKDKEEYRGSDGKREKEKKRVGESERKKVGRREREREKKKEGEKVRETVKYWPQVSIRDREGPIVTFLQICSRW